jgi:hypothetical protein
MNPADFADVARDVLSDPAYQTDFPAAPRPEPQSEPPQWLEDLLRKLVEALEWMFADMPGIDTGAIGDGMRVLMFVVLAAVIIAAILLLVRWVAPKLVRRQRDPSREVADTQPQTPPRRLLDRARQAVEAGDLDLAAGLLLEAVLLAVSERSGQSLREADTARQILRKMRVEAATLDLLRGLVTLRERAHYAGRPPARTDIDSMLARSEAVIAGSS